VQIHAQQVRGYAGPRSGGGCDHVAVRATFCICAQWRESSYPFGDVKGKKLLASCQCGPGCSEVLNFSTSTARGAEVLPNSAVYSVSRLPNGTIAGPCDGVLNT
jgi:hypothetical protein